MEHFMKAMIFLKITIYQTELKKLSLMGNSPAFHRFIVSPQKKLG